MKKLLLVFSVLALLFISCPGGGGSGGGSGGGNFWAQDTSGRDYRVDAELYEEGIYCRIWFEKSYVGNNREIAREYSKKIATEFDSNIYQKLRPVFSGNLPFDGRTYSTMELAGHLVDGDGKLNILLLSIKGTDPSAGVYIAGYFYPVDLFEDGLIPGAHSNHNNIIYINFPVFYRQNNPREDPYVDFEDMYSTIAHETQHLMNFITTLALRTTYDANGDPDDILLMDTWIDEGLSASAEYIYSGKHNEGRIEWYNGQVDQGLIPFGNNFFVWGNREDEDDQAVLDDYATTYLFFHWLRLQAGGNNILQEIITSTNSDYTAVTAAADKYIPGNGLDNWGTLLKTWMAANAIGSSSTIYGYKTDAELNAIEICTLYGATSIRLYQGEAVYSIAGPGYSMPTRSGNIRYAGLNPSSGAVSDTNISNNDYLLTYNINTVKPENSDGSEQSIGENGTIVASLVSPGFDVRKNTNGSRSAQSSLSGPYPISLTDMIRINKRR
ncbi:MAG: hypothetical protein FWG99_03545 [Treponema sp.]|nr:hypothetical protein [Treponema sp.]